MSAAPDAHDPVGRLLDLLDLGAPDGPDRYVVANPDRGYGERVYGGQVAAQALRAASSTVDAPLLVHSLHAYFIRPGRPGVPIVYAVERTRDGRSFATRRVLATQKDEAIFEVSTSFHVPEDGVDYQQPMATDVPSPAEAGNVVSFIPDDARPYLPMEMLELGPTEPRADGYVEATRRVWVRLKRPIGDDLAVHRCVLTFLSDMGALVAARAPVPELALERLMGASLDHALWFHRPMRADEWFLYELRSVSNAGARGLAMGTMHSVDGTLGVSMAQEALLRVRRP